MSWKVLPQSTALFACCLLLAIGCQQESGLEAIIVGDSMAPALWGDSRQVQCDECQFSLRFFDDKQTLPDRLVCPNCGFRSVDSIDSKRLRAEQVQVVPSTTVEYQRWDIVATRPTDGQPAVVKRVVGMPNESLDFRDGDVWANGEIVRKPVAVARQMRVPVFDSKFFSSEVARRLRPVAAPSDWSADEGGWRYVSSAASGSQNAAQNQSQSRRLRYHQWRAVSSTLPRDQDVAIEDWYAGNVGANRDLHPTVDLWLAVNITVHSGGRFAVQVQPGAVPLVFEIDDAMQTLSHGRSRFPLKQLPRQRRHAGADAIPNTGSGESSYEVQLCTFDRRLTLWVDGREMLAFDLPSAVTENVPKFPIQIIGYASDLRLSRFQLWRDVYYYDSMANRNSSGAAFLETGPNEFVLIGDNVPESIDSRHWPKPAVSAASLIGKVSRRAPSDRD